MERVGFAALLMFLGCCGLFGEWLMVTPRVRTGDSGTVFFMSEDPETQNLEVFDPQGKWVQTIPLFRLLPALPSKVYFGFFAVPTTRAPGLYTLSSSRARAQVQVLEREYFAETIPLTRTMTTILADPSPRRQEEARRLWALLESFNSKSFIFPGPIVKPIRDSYRISSGFGDRRIYRYSDGSGSRSIHQGIDLALGTGSRIFSPGWGRVVMAENRIVTGNSLAIEMAPGFLTLMYHLHTLDVKEGDWVFPGQKIGTVGTTGFSTGPHLHWEIRINGIAVEPMAYLEKPLLDKSLLLDMMGEHFNKREVIFHRHD